MLEKINSVLCGLLVPFALIALGIYLAYKLKFFYILHPIKTSKTILKSSGAGGMKSLCVALAGTLGVGNIVGVASALAMGGAGAVFWMWISALCAMSLKYVEVCLGMRYRKHGEKTNYGGAPYYINEGLSPKIGKKSAFAISSVFAILCIANSLSTGNLVQVNAVSYLTPLPKLVFGIIFAVIVLIIIIGGIERIGTFSAFLIPFLTITYMVISLYIILTNITAVPSVLALIIKEAFAPKSVIGGFSGYGILMGMRYGVSRGILSNEAGCGTAPTAHASSDNNDEHSQGCLGIFEVFADTIILCTISALVILIAKNGDGYSDMKLVLYSYGKFTGRFGQYCVIISSVLFALGTVCTQFFYGAESLKYITKSRSWHTLYIIVFFGVCVFSSIIPIFIMWQISDLIIGIMTFIHIICLIFLHRYITNK